MRLGPLAGLLVALALCACSGTDGRPAEPAASPLPTSGPSPSAGPDARVDALLEAVMPAPRDLRLDDLGNADADRVRTAPVLERVDALVPPDPCDPRQDLPLRPAPTWTQARAGQLVVRAQEWEQAFAVRAWWLGDAQRVAAVLDDVRRRAAGCAASVAADPERAFLDARFTGPERLDRGGTRYTWTALSPDGRRRSGDRAWSAQGGLLLHLSVVSTAAAPERPVTSLVASTRVRGAVPLGAVEAAPRVTTRPA